MAAWTNPWTTPPSPAPSSAFPARCEEMLDELGDPPVPIDADTLVVCERFRLVELR